MTLTEDINMLVILRCCVIIWYGITLEIIKFQYKIYHYFMANSVIFQFFNFFIVYKCFKLPLFSQ